jgi:hypothetical protein
MSKRQQPAQDPITVELNLDAKLIVPASTAAMWNAHSAEALDVLSRISNDYLQGFTIEITKQDCAILAHEITILASMCRTLTGMVLEAATDAGGANA